MEGLGDGCMGWVCVCVWCVALHIVGVRLVSCLHPSPLPLRSSEKVRWMGEGVVVVVLFSDLSLEAAGSAPSGWGEEGGGCVGSGRLLRPKKMHGTNREKALCGGNVWR